jgi:phosphoglycerate dehydrogenase-like enzyme
VLEILLLDRLVPEALAWLGERHQVAYRPDLADDPAALRRELYNVQSVVLPRRVQVTREFLDFAPVLRGIARMQGSAESTDHEACRERRVRVIQANSAQVRATAEFLLASLMLLYRRGIAGAVKGDRTASHGLGRELHGSVVGILGLAPAAHALALMLDALGARLIGYDPAVHPTASTWQRLRIQPVSLNDLLSRADAVTAQVLYAKRYEHFINAKALAHCKPGQVWVATTRSALFEPDALATAMADGRIDAAILDGADPAFAGRGTSLYEHPNLYLTPRLRGATREARARGSWYVAQRLHETLTQPRQSGFEALMTGPMGLDSVLPESAPAPLSDC